MHVLADVSIVPLGVGASVSEYVAECEKVFKEAGLKTALHGWGTNIEGEYDQVMAAIKTCHQRLHEKGAPRLLTTIKLGTRTDKEQSLGDKVRSVEEKLGA
jgi:uncharacterized protein (TIGR00106 family)